MIEPAVGRTKPVMASIIVVLPAPFGPIKPDHLARLHREADVVDRDDAAEADREAAHFER